MNGRPDHGQLVCSKCAERTTQGPVQMLSLLRSMGMLKRESEANDQIVWELMRAAAHRIACPSCGHTGVTLERVAEEHLTGDWLESRACEICGQVIPSERLELYPDCQRCAACQDKGQTDEDRIEYCPRCGDIMDLKPRSGGIARYAMKCRSCS